MLWQDPLHVIENTAVTYVKGKYSTTGVPNNRHPPHINPSKDGPNLTSELLRLVCRQHASLEVQPLFKPPLWRLLPRSRLCSADVCTVCLHHTKDSNSVALSQPTADDTSADYQTASCG